MTIDENKELIPLVDCENPTIFGYRDNVEEFFSKVMAIVEGRDNDQH